MGRLNYFGSETIRKFERAAERRYTEAEYLYTVHKLAAAYLYGYAIEMWVKNATYKFLGFGATQIIFKDDRDRLSAAAPAYGVSIGGQHDFLGWTRLFVELRASRSRVGHAPPASGGYDVTLGNQMIAQAVRAYSVWNPGLRYSPYEMDEADALEVREPAEWFRNHYAIFNT